MIAESWLPDGERVELRARFESPHQGTLQERTLSIRLRCKDNVAVPQIHAALVSKIGSRAIQRAGSQLTLDFLEHQTGQLLRQMDGSYDLGLLSSHVQLTAKALCDRFHIILQG